jgi:hypothetical protein
MTAVWDALAPKWGDIWSKWNRDGGMAREGAILSGSCDNICSMIHPFTAVYCESELGKKHGPKQTRAGGSRS